MNFVQLFLRIYDRKINSGEITFFTSGIDKNDFTNLCMNENFVFKKEDLDRICDKMNIIGEEKNNLYELAGYSDK